MRLFTYASDAIEYSIETLEWQFNIFGIVVLHSYQLFVD